MKKNIKWLKYSISLIFLIVSIISIFNYKIDSLGLFGNSNYLSQAAKTLTSGKIVAGLKNYDERLFQELIIKNLEVKNDVIAIGSSRAMHLRKQFLSNQKVNFFNHSVSKAILKDYIAIVGIYEYIYGYIPSTIILGIDPWIFNKYNGQNGWRTLSKYYNYEINKIYNKKKNIKANNINITKWKQLINYDYTISNIKFFINSLKNKDKDKAFYITDTINIDDFIKEPDGSIHYQYSKRFIDAKKAKQIAITYTKAPVYLLEKYGILSHTNLFEKFIEYLLSKNIKVIFFLPPYNPISYDILAQKKQYKYIQKSEEYLKFFAIQNNLELKGSFNPHKYNFTNKDFSDGMHGHDIVTKSIFN